MDKKDIDLYDINKRKTKAHCVGKDQSIYLTTKKHTMAQFKKLSSVPCSIFSHKCILKPSICLYHGRGKAGVKQTFNNNLMAQLEKYLILLHSFLCQEEQGGKMVERERKEK